MHILIFSVLTGIHLEQGAKTILNTKNQNKTGNYITGLGPYLVFTELLKATASFQVHTGFIKNNSFKNALTKK